MLARILIEFGFVTFWFISWQLLAFIYSKVESLIKGVSHDTDT